MTTACLRRRAAPLLEEEGYRSRDALIPEIADPLGLYRSMTTSTLTARDHPLDAAKIKVGEWPD